MKRLTAILLLLAPAAVAQEAALDPERVANSIPLDETAVKNLRIETVAVEEQEFETTVFAIGRIEEIPSKHSVLSSRIAGRVVAIEVFEGDEVAKGQVLARVESRQPGNPPPTIELKAPQAGIVIASHIRIGEPVEPDKELLDIADRSTMWAVAKVPENDAPGIAPGTKARIHIPALGDQTILATMTRFGIQADRDTGTVEAIFELDNSEKEIRPGMRAEFSLITATRPNVPSIPRVCVQGDPTRRVVFVKDLELPNVFIRTPIVLGEQNEEFVEVISGLFPGDEVVARGSYPLSFAQGGSGLSLKDVLDAAHGHEHADDGSELTAEDLAAHEAEARGDNHGEGQGGVMRRGLLIYSGVVTVLFLVVFQLYWTARRAARPIHAE